MNIWSVIRQNTIHQMNIQSVICLIPAYTEWIFGRTSAWPLHTWNEYLVSNLPDPCIHPLNIWSIICLILEYIKWIFSQKSASYTYIHCLLYWYLPKALVMLIEYLVGNNCVIWSLSQAVCLLDSIGYPISDIRKSDNGSLLIGHVTYMYWILFHWPIWYIYYVSSSRHPLGPLKWYIVIV
jgi:hypothetical protein